MIIAMQKSHLCLPYYNVHTPLRHIGVQVFSLDPDSRAKASGHQLASVDQAPDLLIAKAEIGSGLLDRQEDEGLGIFVVVGHRHGSALASCLFRHCRLRRCHTRHRFPRCLARQ